MQTSFDISDLGQRRGWISGIGNGYTTPAAASTTRLCIYYGAFLHYLLLASQQQWIVWIGSGYTQTTTSSSTRPSCTISFWNHHQDALTGSNSGYTQTTTASPWLAVAMHKRQHYELHTHLAPFHFRITVRVRQSDLTVAVQVTLMKWQHHQVRG